MASNIDQLLKQYVDGAREDSRSEIDRSSSLEFYYTKKCLHALTMCNWKMGASLKINRRSSYRAERRFLFYYYFYYKANLVIK